MKVNSRNLKKYGFKAILKTVIRDMKISLIKILVVSTYKTSETKGLTIIEDNGYVQENVLEMLY